MTLDDVGAVTLPEVAAALGLELDGAGRTLTPCPACDAERRGSNDPRGPVGFTADQAGWRCHRCGAGGSAIDLAGYRLTDGRLTAGDRDGWRAVLGWYGLLLGAGEPGKAKRRRSARNEPRACASPRRAAARPRPSPDQVCALRNACGPVTEDRAVAAWLTGRGIDPEVVASLDLARALPSGVALPDWARCVGHPWSDGWRCILPAHDHAGGAVTVRARWVGPGEAPHSVKAAAAAAGPDSAGGAVLSCLHGRSVLRTGRAPAYWPDGAPLRIVVAEGETDWLSWRVAVHADTLARRGHADAVREHGGAVVWGVWAGAWTNEIAARVPSGSVVIVRTDADAAGDRCAEVIRRSLVARCDVRRDPGGSADAA